MSACFCLSFAVESRCACFTSVSSGEKFIAAVRAGSLIAVLEMLKSDSKLLAYRDASDLSALLHASKLGNAVMVKVSSSAGAKQANRPTLAHSVRSRAHQKRRCSRTVPRSTKPAARCKRPRCIGSPCSVTSRCVSPKCLCWERRAERDLQVAKQLLASSADVALRTRVGRTPLHMVGSALVDHRTDSAELARCAGVSRNQG